MSCWSPFCNGTAWCERISSPTVPGPARSFLNQLPDCDDSEKHIFGGPRGIRTLNNWWNAVITLRCWRMLRRSRGISHNIDTMLLFRVLENAHGARPLCVEGIDVTYVTAFAVPTHFQQKPFAATSTIRHATFVVCVCRPFGTMRRQAITQFLSPTRLLCTPT